jgi:hypothetical protein
MYLLDLVALLCALAALWCRYRAYPESSALLSACSLAAGWGSQLVARRRREAVLASLAGRPTDRPAVAGIAPERA